MKKIILVVVVLLISASGNSVRAQAQVRFDTPYGHNAAVGKYAQVNGINMYYEEYGSGEPLLLIHGNGGDIRSMANQIDYFKSNYKVIVADSRGHGKSELGTDSLTYVQMADDWDGLVEFLKLDSVNIIGWSDGGIISLLMGINQRSPIKRIVAMGANLRPDTTAVYPWAPNDVFKMLDDVSAMIQKHDSSRNWDLIKQQLDLLLFQPNITHEQLGRIACPVLVIAGDKDIIREEHTVEIYQNIPRAQLCIMPGETHFAPAKDPEVFNAIAEKFIAKPFNRPDSNWTKRK